MFSIVNDYSKKVVALLSGKTATRIGRYTIPQFGNEPAKKKTEKYSDEEITQAIQEALDYFQGGDGLVRFLNWAVIVAAQRKSNNDLRTSAAGLDASSQARVTLVMNLAKRAAEAEVTELDEKGEEKPIDRKSDAYLAALRDSINASLAKPKFADLRAVFEGAEGGTIPFDLTIPGSLNDSDEDVPAATEETQSQAETESATA